MERIRTRRRVGLSAAVVSVVMAGHAWFLVEAAGADCLPCVYVTNGDPYVYVEVCPPV